MLGLPLSKGSEVIKEGWLAGLICEASLPFPVRSPHTETKKPGSYVTSESAESHAIRSVIWLGKTCACEMLILITNNTTNKPLKIIFLFVINFAKHFMYRFTLANLSK